MPFIKYIFFFSLPLVSVNFSFGQCVLQCLLNFVLLFFPFLRYILYIEC